MTVLSREKISTQNTIEITPRLTPEARNRLIIDNFPLVKSTAGAMKPHYPTIDYDDLVGIGQIGLIKAIDCYNPTKGELSTCICNYIKWEYQHSFRDHWQQVKIERSHWERNNKLKKLNSLGLTDEEIAQEFNISLKELAATKESLGVLSTIDIADQEIIQNHNYDDESNFLIKIFRNLTNRQKEAYGFIYRARHDLTIAELAVKMKTSPANARNCVNQLLLIGLVKRQGNTLAINTNLYLLDNYQLLERISGKLRQVFDVVCLMDKATTEAIASNINIHRRQAEYYCRRLVSLQLLLRDGLFIYPNFAPFVVEGMKKAIIKGENSGNN